MSEPQIEVKHTERTMLDRLNRRYGASNYNGFRYARAEHVKLTAGFDTRRICDYMALDLWPGGYGDSATGPLLHGHEVKVSRADWRAELKDPTKAEAFAQFCDYWWLVVSDKSIVRDDLPDGWGLLVATGSTLRSLRQPVRRTPEPFGRHQQATFARAVTKTTLRLAATDPALINTTRALRLDQEKTRQS